MRGGITMAVMEVGQERAQARVRLEAARRRERARQARLTATLAVVAVLSGFLVAFTSDEAIFSPEAFGTVDQGAVEVFDEFTQSWSPVGVGEDLIFSTRFRTGPGVGARLDVRTGTVEFAPGTEGRVNPGTVDIDRGSVLFDVAAFYLGRSPELIARADGQWRIDGFPNPRIATYRGSASATGGQLIAVIRAEARTLRDFNEVRLDRDALTEVAPLAYTVTDPWDARLASDLLAVDEVVGQALRGINATYGGDPRPESFYTAFTVVDDALERGLEQFDTLGRTGGFGPPADVLVAVLVARLIARRSSITFPEAIDEVDSFRSIGATWGHILVRRELTAQDFVASLDLSLRQVAGLGDEAPRPVVRPRPTPAPSATPSPTPTVTEEPTEEPTSEPTEQPTDEPTEEPTTDPTSPPESCNDPGSQSAQCVTDIVDQLLNLVDDIIPPLLGARLPAILLGLFGARG